MSLGFYGIITVGVVNNFSPNPVKNKFIGYSNYFGKIADAGLSASQEIYKTINEINLVDISTFSRNELETHAINRFIQAMSNAYENVFSNEYNTNTMSASFEGLINYIETKSGTEYQDFLTNNNIRVNKVYASVSNAIGMPINSANIIE